MPNHTNKTANERKQAELDSIITANREIHKKLQDKYRQAIPVNVDANLLPEFINYLEKIGVITDLQGIEFGIEHANSVTEQFKELDDYLGEQVKKQKSQKLSVPHQPNNKLIIPGH